MEDKILHETPFIDILSKDRFIFKSNKNNLFHFWMVRSCNINDKEKTLEIKFAITQDGLFTKLDSMKLYKSYYPQWLISSKNKYELNLIFTDPTGTECDKVIFKNCFLIDRFYDCVYKNDELFVLTLKFKYNKKENVFLYNTTRTNRFYYEENKHYDEKYKETLKNENKMLEEALERAQEHYKKENDSESSTLKNLEEDIKNTIKENNAIINS